MRPFPEEDEALDAFLRAGEPELAPASEEFVMALRESARGRIARRRRLAIPLCAAALLVATFLLLSHSVSDEVPNRTDAPTRAELALLRRALDRLEHRVLEARVEALERSFRGWEEVESRAPREQERFETRVDLAPALRERVERARSLGLDAEEALDVVRLAILRHQPPVARLGPSIDERRDALRQRHGEAAWWPSHTSSPR